MPREHYDMSFHRQEKLPSPRTSLQLPGTPGKTVDIMVPFGSIFGSLPDVHERNAKQAERDEFAPFHSPCSVSSGKG